MVPEKIGKNILTDSFFKTLDPTKDKRSTSVLHYYVKPKLCITFLSVLLSVTRLKLKLRRFILTIRATQKGYIGDDLRAGWVEGCERDVISTGDPQICHHSLNPSCRRFSFCNKTRA